MSGQQTRSWAPEPRPARRRRGLEVVLVLGFLFCLLLGAAALAALWILTRPTPVAPTAAPDMVFVQPERVVVGLATRVLAGDDPTALVGQALQAGELETAAALLLHDTSSPPAARAALWQQLARLLLDAGDKGRATLAYDRVLQLAVLEPALYSLGRSQLLLLAVTGFAAADQPEAAADAAWQTVRSIAQSPDLLPAQRSELIQDLRPMIVGPERAVEDTALASRVEELSRNPYGTVTGAVVPFTWSLFQTSLPMDDATSAALAAATDTRRLTARNLADRYVLTSGTDVEPEQRALAAALVAEDALRVQAAQAALGSASTLQQQIAVMLVEQSRLIGKLQVARGALGMTIVPEWVAARATIEAELAGVMATIDRLVGALADAQATPLEQNLMRLEMAHWLAVQSLLGFWPGSDPAQIGERLRFAQDELQRLGSPVALPVAWDMTAPVPGFRLLPRE